MITDNVSNPFFDYKITPLPWSLKCDEKSKFYISITRHSNRDTIARVSKNKTSNHEHDAKYIVHSVNILPELIEALDQSLRQWEMYMTDIAQADLEDLILDEENTEAQLMYRFKNVLKRAKELK